MNPRNQQSVIKNVQAQTNFATDRAVVVMFKRETFQVVEFMQLYPCHDALDMMKIENLTFLVHKRDIAKNSFLEI